MKRFGSGINHTMYGLRLALLILLVALAMSGRAQTVTISGEVERPMTLQAHDLKAMPHTNVMAKDRDGKEHTYSGISVFELLKQAGTTLDNELRGKNLTKFVAVKAADNYEVIFALAEIDPDFTSRTILLADSVDGVPLGQGVGPYRIVVPGEKKPARWIREVKSMEVRFAK